MGLFVPLSLVFLKRCCCCLQFCKIHLVAGIFVLCSFSLCLASDALLEFFVCVFFWSLEFSWEFFFKIFVILLLDLFSNFVLVRIKKGSFLGLFVVSFLISIPLSSLLLVCLLITFLLWFKTCWVSKSLFSSTSLTTFSLYLFLTPWRRRTRSCRSWWWWCS